MEKITQCLALIEHEWAPPRGCRGAFLFVGPTGVGKTQLAITLGEEFLGEGRLARFDASEFARRESLETLLGDGKGWPGRLAGAYDAVPEGVWLIDEIEKGCPEFKDLLLQITDAGRVTLASGRALDFSRIYLIATSNLGSADILERENLPFTSLETHVVKCLEQWLRPELLARFESPFVFQPLDFDAQKEITRKRLTELQTWQRERHGRRITFDEDVVEFLVVVGFSRRYGARPLLRCIDRMVGQSILDDLDQGGSGSGQLVVNGDKLQLRRIV